MGARKPRRFDHWANRSAVATINKYPLMADRTVYADLVRTGRRRRPPLGIMLLVAKEKHCNRPHTLVGETQLFNGEAITANYGGVARKPFDDLYFDTLVNKGIVR